MRIHRKIVWDWDGNIVEDVTEDYCGSVAEAKGDDGKKKSTTTQEPWGPQQDYLTKGFAEAWDQYNSDNPQYYPTSTVAATNANQQAGQQGIIDTAASSTLPDTASAYLSDVMGGDYLKDPSTWAAELTNPNLGQDPNAYIGDVTDSIWASVFPQITSNYALNGRSGASPVAQGVLAKEFARGIAPYAFNSAEAAQSRLFQAGESALDRGTSLYGDERNRQMTAASQAPTVEQSRYIAPNAVLDVGNQQQTQAQKELDDSVNRWNFDQNIDAAKLKDYMSLIGGNYGGTTNSTETTSSGSGNPLLSGLGAVSSLFGIGGK